MSINTNTENADNPITKPTIVQRPRFRAPTPAFSANAKNAAIPPRTAVRIEITWLVLKFCTVKTIVTHKTMMVGSTVTCGSENVLITAINARYSHVAFHHNRKNLQARARRYRRRLVLQKRRRKCLNRAFVVDPAAPPTPPK